MGLTLELPAALEERRRAAAKAYSMEVGDFAVAAIAEAVQIAEGPPLSEEELMALPQEQREAIMQAQAEAGAELDKVREAETPTAVPWLTGSGGEVAV